MDVPVLKNNRSVVNLDYLFGAPQKMLSRVVIASHVYARFADSGILSLLVFEIFWLLSQGFFQRAHHFFQLELFWFLLSKVSLYVYLDSQNIDYIVSIKKYLYTYVTVTIFRWYVESLKMQERGGKNGQYTTFLTISKIVTLLFQKCGTAPERREMIEERY